MSNALEVTTPSDREIRVARAFDAPRALVFDAYTKPELVSRWLLGPPGWTMPVCEIDLKAGGRYRWVWRHENGREMGAGGVYREVVPPERIVHIELFDEDWTGGEALVTTEFTERGGKTMVTVTVLYSSKAARDGALKTGMTDGMEAGHRRLDEILASALAEARPPAAPGECGIVTVERQLTAVARAQVRLSEIPAAERSLRKMIDDAVGSVDVAPLGHGFTLWRPMGDGRLDLEPGIVVSRVFEPIGEVMSSTLPAGRAVRFLHVGSYEGLPDAWHTLFAWSAKEGHKLADINWQIYGDWNDDPAKLETSLHALLA